MRRNTRAPIPLATSLRLAVAVAVTALAGAGCVEPDADAPAPTLSSSALSTAGAQRLIVQLDRPTAPAGLRVGVPGVDAVLAANGALRARNLATPRPGRDAALMARHGLDRLLVVELPAGAVAADVVAALRAQPAVTFVDFDRPGEGAVVPSDTSYPQQWHHENLGQTGGTVDADVDAEGGWAWSTGDVSVVVAVLDTGVDSAHPELVGRQMAGYDFVNGDADPEGDHGHGTYCSGILGANANNDFAVAGVDWAATMMPVKVLDAENRGLTSHLIDGILFAADNGADVLSMSLINYPCGYSPLASALQYALDRGAILVSSAGNGGVGNADLSGPGCYPQTISVGATDHDDARASFSATGAALDVVAPGLGVPTVAYRDYSDTWTGFSGTSAAAPVVAGMASLMRALDPTITHDAVLAVLTQTAEDQVGPPSEDLAGRDDSFGWGRVNLAAALAAVNPGPLPDVIADDVAIADRSIASTTQGALSDTWTRGGAAYDLREVTTRGAPASRTSVLEHELDFDVTGGGDRVTLYVRARVVDVSGEGDAFRLAYSGDGGQTFTLALVISSTSYPTEWTTFELPADTVGPVIVRVTDTDRTAGATGTDSLRIDHMFIGTSRVTEDCTSAPVADFGASPTSGSAPLSVSFADLSTHGPTAWEWAFGDGTFSSQRHPQHVYGAAGSYNVTLTVTNACGSDSLTRADLITVSEPAEPVAYVASQRVTRVSAGGPNRAAEDTVVVWDRDGAGVAGASVTATYTGPTSGTVSGVTDEQGVVVLRSTKTGKNLTAEWCFTVTDVSAAAHRYDPDANVVTTACESGAID